jgi:hypothetical protein
MVLFNWLFTPEQLHPSGGDFKLAAGLEDEKSLIQTSPGGN